MVPAKYFSDYGAPLRERMEDIALLVDFFVDKISKRLGKSIESIPTSVMNALQDYQSLGNVGSWKTSSSGR